MKKILFIFILFATCFTNNLIGQKITLQPKIGIFIDDYHHEGLTYAAETEFKFNKSIGLSITIQPIQYLESDDTFLSMPLMVHYYPIKKMALKLGYDLCGRYPFAISFEHNKIVFETRYCLKKFDFAQNFILFTIGYKIDI